jgi:2-oxoglutarate ferredoxin oxidoreductase subunit alpha
MTVDVTIRIAGQAGQGIQSISAIMGKIFTRHGFYAFINQDAESRIRGGHNFDQVRIKDEPVYAIRDKLDYLICLDENAIERLNLNPITPITFPSHWNKLPWSTAKARLW